MIVRNLLKVIKNPIALIGFLIGIFIIVFPTWYFMEPELVINNQGKLWFYQEIVLAGIIAVLFGLFIAGTIYKIRYFKNPNSSKAGMLGGFFGVIVSGCPACSISLVSYLGLAGIVGVLPYQGLELKYLSVIILLYASYSTLKNLEVCKIKKPKKV